MSITAARRTTCRLCGAAAPDLVLSLPPTPPANAFVQAGARGRAQARYPLDLMRCTACGHVQLRDVVSPFELFQRHRSAIAGDPTNAARAGAFARDLLGRHRLAPGALVLEIGSNDGTLLKAFEAAGYRVQGVEPAVDLARTAIAADVPTHPGFFGPGIADRLEDEHGPAEVVIASGVLAHVDDLRGTIESLSRLLAHGGLLAFEVPYLADIVERGLIDVIRHENLDYHAVRLLSGIFLACDLELIAVQRVSAQGGRLRGYAQHLGGPHAADGTVAAFCDRERDLGCDGAAAVKALPGHVDALRHEIGAMLATARAAGQRIAAWGAPARATTLMAALGLDAETLEFVVDEAAWKHGLFTPGAQVPIVPPEAVDERRPDWLVVFAWDRADAVVERCAAFRERGGRLLVPLPTLRVI